MEGEEVVDRMASVLNTAQLRLQQLVGFNDAEDEIFFTAGDPSQPGSAHLYTLNLPPLRPTLQSNSTHLSSPSPVCISCHQNDPSCLSSRFTAAPKVIQVGWKILKLQPPRMRMVRVEGGLPYFSSSVLGLAFLIAESSVPHLAKSSQGIN